ncbi:hypothetical protein T492DRAFT_837910 [Pavlovales sp. CCMP2436]|nr:hypothetical protein T492DRAFT_837910 [Pavlovales sp. CCMP2436]
MAEDRRDALAKAVYTRMFAMVIDRLNDVVKTGPPSADVNTPTKPSKKENALGAANGAHPPGGLGVPPARGGGSAGSGGYGSGLGSGGNGWIGILDIYGFECMPTNHFEQIYFNF